jgi:hypothetical protein
MIIEGSNILRIGVRKNVSLQAVFEITYLLISVVFFMDSGQGRE